MADMALADACTAANPRVPKKEDIVKIYTKLVVFLKRLVKPQRGRKAAAPLHTPRAFFRVLDCGGRKGIDLCLYAAVVPG